MRRIILHHCFWIPFVNNQDFFFCCVVHMCPWGLYLWPTYWGTPADYRQATTNTGGWGNLWMCWLFLTAVCIYPCLSLFTPEVTSRFFWERTKNDEFRNEVLFFLQFSFLWFRCFFLSLTFFHVSKKQVKQFFAAKKMRHIHILLKLERWQVIF